MAGLELLEFVLLTCDFQVTGEPDAAEQPPEADETRASELETVTPELESEEMIDLSVEDDITWETLSLPGVAVRYSVSSNDAGDVVLLVLVELTDPVAPYRLVLTTGSRFTAPDDIDAALRGNVETTLLFMSYPYIRETVASITARSPHRAFMMPPLTRLPHPRVTGQEEDSSQTPEQSTPEVSE